MKIAIIKLSSLGDIIHASVCLALIKAHVKNAHISWFVDASFGELLKSCALIDELILLPLKDKNYKQSLQIVNAHKNSFDVIIDLQGLIKSGIVARLLGANTYGFSYTSAKEALASIFYRHKLVCDYNENVILRNANLCAFALNFSYSADEIVNKSAIFSSKLASKIKGQKYILIAPFASEISKCYAHYDKLIGLLKNELKEYEIFIIQNGGKEETKARQIAQNSGAKVLENSSFDELVAIINNAKLLIGNDSGITHLAWAQNTATITLFGNRPSSRNAFITPKNLVIDAGKKINARKINKNDFCINEISPQIIAQRALELIKEHR